MQFEFVKSAKKIIINTNSIALHYFKLNYIYSDNICVYDKHPLAGQEIQY